MRQPRAVTSRKLGRPHLGPREVVVAALTSHELELVDALRGDLCRSTFLNLLLTETVGRRDLLQPTQFDLFIAALIDDKARQRLNDAIVLRPKKSVPNTTVRVHPEVRRELEVRRCTAGMYQCRYIGHIVRERLLSSGQREPSPGNDLVSPCREVVVDRRSGQSALDPGKP